MFTTSQREKCHSRSLPLDYILKLAEDLEGFYPGEDGATFKAALDDKTLFRGAKTIADFRGELEDEDDVEVVQVSIRMGKSGALTWLHWKQDFVSLETRGRIEQEVHGVFWPMEHRISKCFKAIDRNAANKVPQVLDSKGVDPNVELPVHHDPKPWWMNPWVIALVTATIGAIIATLLVSRV